MTFFKHIWLLTWKNFVLQKRKPVVTVFEILLPIFFAVLLLFIRLLVEVDPIDTTTIWNRFSVENLNPSPDKPYLLYYPNQTKLNDVMNNVTENINKIGRMNVSLFGFQNEDDLLLFNSANSEDIWAAVNFEDTKDYTTAIPKDIVYKLRVATSSGNNQRWNTGNTYPFFQIPGYRNNQSTGGDPNYYSRGFLYLQYEINKQLINEFAETPIDFDNIDMFMEKMPYPPFVRDFLLPTIQQQLPLFLILGFILYALQLSKGIVYEKERRLKEAMKMMGMSPSVYWASWFIKGVLYLTVSSLVYAVLFAVKTEKGSVLAESNPVLIFLFLMCYSISIIAFCFMFSTFFNKANIGANATGILFYLTYVPYFFLQQRYEDMSVGEKIAACLLSNVAMAFGLNAVGVYEGTGEGAQFSNFTNPATVDDNFPLLYAMLMLLGDSVLYFFIGWYVDSVHPGEFGVPQPWYFLFTPTYWCGSSTSTTSDKFYREFGNGDGKKVAVSDLSLNIYKGQITALLGHNGAGKTTTMSMLTGLQSKADSLSKTLSGGQKRKLSVGIALIGGTKIIVLDEPTSGMDPAARRQTWDILQKFRKDRVIILSTHFMDEADLLGDRIAIMAEGVIQCCGSSLFLKKAYGTGYHLVIVKDKSCDVQKLTSVIKTFIPTAELKSAISAELSYLLPFDEARKFEGLFMEIESRKDQLGVSSFGTTATTMEEVFIRVGELATEVEDDDEINELTKMNGYTNPNYGSVSQRMNGNALRLPSEAGIESKPNGSCTLEGITEDVQFIEFNKDLIKNYGIIWFIQQFYAMILKKIIHTARNRIVTAVQLIVPVVFTIFALSVEKTIPKQQDEPALLLDLSPFTNPIMSLNVQGGANNLISAYLALTAADGYQTENSSLSQSALENFLSTKAQSIGVSTFNKRYIIGLDMETLANQRLRVTSLFNGQPFHSPAISLAYTMDAIMKSVTDMSHSITTINYPLPRRIGDDTNAITAGTIGTAFIVAFCILFGMAFLTTSFIIFLIKEKASGAKHMQVVSGVKPLAFWSSTFVWDMVNYLVPVLLILVVFAAFQVEAYTGDDRLGLVFILFLIYGWAVLPFVYILHYFFKTAAGGMVAVTMLNIITGLATLMAVFVLKIPQLNAEDVSNVLDWVFTVVIPNYCVGEGLMNIYTNYEYKKTCDPVQPFCPFLDPKEENPLLSCCPGKCGASCLAFTDNYLDWEFPGIGKYFLFMAFQGFLYFFLILLIESGVLNRCFYSIFKNEDGYLNEDGNEDEEHLIERAEDDDVAEERRRINVTPIGELMNSDSLILKNITKTYGSFLAVDNICVGVPRQECFGLLGQNGAGKTSTFKILTGDQMLTSGNAYVNRYSIRQDIKQVQENLGYCPQFDALIDQMTGRETLTMYARLRGVNEYQIKHIVDNLIDVLMLKKYADRQCGFYSGGNKRKLSTAMALIGDPPFVMLDEPTTGMDPAARRQLWNVLSQIRASGRTLILTSHSMEECDALCTKIAIMVNGNFMCLGSPQHLKNKFGHGYTLVVRQGTDNAAASSAQLKDFVKSTFPNSQIFDDHQGYLHFQIPDADVPLASVFGAMEKAKTSFNIEDYSVHQTTLEQVFLTFTRNQTPPTETTKSFNCNKFCGCGSE
ncbi:hypothetical protein KUTeg_011297 [Tegillarca granosa]|uniref:ABC transporter domain-containing protein n=1 Tax=Tegillarca granosa TaxID=220873 RepID=A0ABQ9F6D3_TEGGR|nr:hypothetical protein KUTeg_011297 [Tegillarca granosa]